MNTFTDEKLAGMPKSQAVVVLDFENSEVISGFVPETYVLVVSGKKPYANMNVLLIPRIYVQQPDYWQIEVAGIMPRIGLPAESPFVETLPLDGFLGKKGIEVVGATGSQKIDLPFSPSELCNENDDVSYRADQVPGGVIIIADGKHNTSGYETFFEQMPMDVYPPEFALKHRSPTGIVLEVVTPFNVWTSFNATEKIETVIVNDAQGHHKVSVEQTPD